MVNMVHTYTVHMAAEWRKKVKINSIPLNNPHPQLHQQKRTQKKHRKMFTIVRQTI